MHQISIPHPRILTLLCNFVARPALPEPPPQAYGCCSRIALYHPPPQIRRQPPPSPRPKSSCPLLALPPLGVEVGTGAALDTRATGCDALLASPPPPHLPLADALRVIYPLARRICQDADGMLVDSSSKAAKGLRSSRPRPNAATSTTSRSPCRRRSKDS